MSFCLFSTVGGSNSCVMPWTWGSFWGIRADVCIVSGTLSSSFESGFWCDEIGEFVFSSIEEKIMLFSFVASCCKSEKISFEQSGVVWSWFFWSSVSE